MAEVRALYAELDAAIARHRPVCRNRGLCCSFGAFGHRLFVTTLELAYFLAGLGGGSGPHEEHRPSDDPGLDAHPRPHERPTSDRVVPLAAVGDACPYHQADRCTAREHRPTGCRIFFCEPSAAEWQPSLTEAYLTRLRGLHDGFGVPYVYTEWLSALRQLRNR